MSYEKTKHEMEKYWLLDTSKNDRYNTNGMVQYCSTSILDFFKENDVPDQVARPPLEGLQTKEHQD